MKQEIFCMGCMKKTEHRVLEIGDDRPIKLKCEECGHLKYNH